VVVFLTPTLVNPCRSFSKSQYAQKRVITLETLSRVPEGPGITRSLLAFIPFLLNAGPARGWKKSTRFLRVIRSFSFHRYFPLYHVPASSSASCSKFHLVFRSLPYIEMQTHSRIDISAPVMQVLTRVNKMGGTCYPGRPSLFLGGHL
jgi:hypothetical protein